MIQTAPTEELSEPAKALAATVDGADAPKKIAKFDERGQCVGVDDPCESKEDAI